METFAPLAARERNPLLSTPRKCGRNERVHPTLDFVPHRRRRAIPFVLVIMHFFRAKDVTWGRVRVETAQLCQKGTIVGIVAQQSRINCLTVAFVSFQGIFRPSWVSFELWSRLLLRATGSQVNEAKPRGDTVCID